MSANKTGWVITNGTQYLKSNKANEVTSKIEEAYFWKKDSSANSVLGTLTRRKKNPLNGYGVQFVGPKTQNTQPPKSKETIEQNVCGSVTAHSNEAKEPNNPTTQIANNVKNFLSEILNDNLFAKEIVGMHFIPKFQQEKSPFTFGEIRTSLSIVRNLTDPGIQQTLYNELTKVDMELVDIEHKIEMTNFNACDGYRLAKEMQEARRKRREIKDMLEIFDSVSKNTAAQAVQDAINAIETKHSQRTYTPRVRTDLFETVD